MSLIVYAYEKMYTLLKMELDECLQPGMFKNVVENCFVIAGNYWSELRATVAEYRFRSQDEEILFFKKVKPLFTAELEFFSLVYHSLLFCPCDVDGEMRFWQREYRRLGEFNEKYSEFIDYYRSGRTDMDQFYYLRFHEMNAMDADFESYDSEPCSRTSHDRLIAKLWALERYSSYVEKKLIEVSKLM